MSPSKTHRSTAFPRLLVPPGLAASPSARDGPERPETFPGA
jgi:hypothetical protein